MLTRVTSPMCALPLAGDGLAVTMSVRYKRTARTWESEVSHHLPFIRGAKQYPYRGGVVLLLIHCCECDVLGICGGGGVGVLGCGVFAAVRDAGCGHSCHD